jgi:serine/threonine-protein kinase RsbW
MAAPPPVWTMPALLRSTMFPARLDQLNGLRAFLEGFCTQAAVGSDGCLRLNLLLEELFTNTVRHGHRGNCEAPVWISLAAGEDARVRVSYEDTAPPFNPYAQASLDTTQEIRKVGGRGLALLRKLAPTRDYAYLFGRNTIRIALSLD